jgi:threonine/homoserine/homoserine lactone efflux protein
MMLFKGLKFGMIIQLAIGPVCLFIFKLASTDSFLGSETAVLAVALIDAIYILLALVGITAFIENVKVQTTFKLVGAGIVGLYGLVTLAGVWGWQLIPSFNLFGNLPAQSPFLAGLLLTVSNPLTILFWSGVFSAKIAEEKMKRGDAYQFGVGCVMATLLFLTAVAIIGSFTQYFLPTVVVTLLNGLVGIILIYFAVKMLFKKI